MTKKSRMPCVWTVVSAYWMRHDSDRVPSAANTDTHVRRHKTQGHPH